jgi:hypothetical protein
MAYGDPQLLHLDAMLTDISVGYQGDDYVADLFYPSITVNKQSNKYYVYTRDIWGRATDDLRAPGARANELPPMTLSRDQYFVEEHALEDVVPIEEQQNADDPLMPLVDATERVMNTILLNKEQTRVTALTTTGNYASGHSVTLSGTGQWNDYVNSVPISDIKAAKKKVHDKMFRDPNTWVAQYEVAQKLEDHPAFITRIQYSQMGVTTDEIIAQVVGMPIFKRAGAGLVTSVYGQAETYGYMWSKDVVFAWVPPAPGRKVPAFAYEFLWNYDTGGARVTERWFDIDRKADIVRTSHRYTQKFISLDGSGKAIAGYVIKAAVA